jgi:AcrR family transcriptional regulator
MTNNQIARAAGVNRSDVTNYFAAENGDESRIKFVSGDKRAKIAAAIGLTKAELVRRHLLAGKTITPLESWKLYGLHALGQTITRLKKTMDVRNIVPEREQNQRHAIYAYFPPNTGDPK